MVIATSAYLSTNSARISKAVAERAGCNQLQVSESIPAVTQVYSHHLYCIHWAMRVGYSGDHSAYMYALIGDVQMFSSQATVVGSQPSTLVLGIMPLHMCNESMHSIIVIVSSSNYFHFESHFVACAVYNTFEFIQICHDGVGSRLIMVEVFHFH